MKLATAQNAKRNISFGLAYKLFQVLSQFLIRTCLIYTLGAAYLGIEGLFASILKVLTMAELGFGGAVIYSMYRPLAEDDTATVCALLALFKKLYRAVGLIILFLGLCLLPFLPRLIRGSVPDGLNLTVLYLIYLANTTLTYLAVAYKSSILTALHRNDLLDKAMMISQGILLVLQVAILFLWKNYYLFLIVCPFCTLLNNGIVYYLCEKHFPQYRPAGKVSRELKKDIVTRMFGIFISRLSTSTRNSFDSIFTAAFLGLVLTAVYNNYLYIVFAVSSLMRILTDSIRAGIGNKVALYSLRRNYLDMEKMNFLFMTVSGWASACILCLMQPFMSLWVGPELVLPLGTAVLFVLYFYLLRIGDVRTIYVNATGIWWEMRYRAILEAACNIVLNYFLGKAYGLPGILLATIISLTAFNILYGSPFLFRLYFRDQKVSDYFRQHAVYFLAAALCCGLTAFLCFCLTGKSELDGPKGLLLGQLAVRAAVCCLFPPLFYWLVFRNSRLYILAVPWILDQIPALKRVFLHVRETLCRTGKHRDLARIRLSDAERDAAVPLLKQWDRRWGRLPYFRSTVGTSGSLPVCLSAAVTALTGWDGCTPAEAASFHEKNAGEKEAGRFIAEYAGRYGVSVENGEGMPASVPEQGAVWICALGPGRISDDAGHYVLLSDWNRETAGLYDPLSAAGAAERIPVSELREQLIRYWELFQR